MEKVNLSSPWAKLYREISALFDQDKHVRVVFDEDENTIKLYVDNEAKAEAIGKLLPTQRTFGNVTVNINVIPANTDDPLVLLETAFEGNPALSFTKNAPVQGGTFRYAVFESRVVQFFNDDISDINGNCTTLYQEIAKDVLENAGDVFFCTEDKTGPWQF